MSLQSSHRRHRTTAQTSPTESLNTIFRQNITMAPSSLLSMACTSLAIVSPSFAFVLPQTGTAKCDPSKTSLTVSNDGGISGTTRRGFMDNVASATAAIAGGSFLLTAPSPAIAYGLNKANDKLARYVTYFFYACSKPFWMVDDSSCAPHL